MTRKKPALTAAPRGFEPGPNEAAYVAYLLAIPPGELYPLEIDSSEDGQQHLIDSMLIEVTRLTRDTAEIYDASPEFAAYKRTLQVCRDVLDGRRAAPPPEADWAFESAGIRRGGYLPEGSR